MSSLKERGFDVIDNVYTAQELAAIDAILAGIDSAAPNFRRTTELFAIRQFLREVPGIVPLIFNAAVKDIIRHHIGGNYFVVRSIYFDKPPLSNWAVPWHQDMTISVSERKKIEGFTGWTVKHGQFSVCPPAGYMENICTVRLHLDDTDGTNGALRVIPGSHKNGIIRTDMLEGKENTVTVSVPPGGLMLMKPLLFHSSDKTTNERKRRVIHIELSDIELPEGMQWSERMIVFS